MPKLIALLLLALSALSIGTLVSGTSYSEWLLPGGLPLGNALAAAGLCFLAGAAFLLSPPSSIRRRVCRAALVSAILWLPVSIALAGNLELNFSGSRGTAWLVASSVTAIAVLSSLLWAAAGLLFGSSGKSSSIRAAG
ncbi:hypothetical protein [Luteimonas suaedae]|uniref:hypothetical protein n=1 Tax=Luteimonas suaedae TaxID=2605430 RepID=UPI0011EC36B3|nr:hypothetical protein [Luteimonas suaedae]